jgi:hypothetical protein
MWDLWWTKWHWGRFSPSTSVSPANPHSTDCSTVIIIIIIRGWYNRPTVADVPSGLSLTPPRETKKKTYHWVVSRLRMPGAILQLPQYAFILWWLDTGATSPLNLTPLLIIFAYNTTYTETLRLYFEYFPPTEWLSFQFPVGGDARNSQQCTWRVLVPKHFVIMFTDPMLRNTKTHCVKQRIKTVYQHPYNYVRL